MIIYEVYVGGFRLQFSLKPIQWWMLKPVHMNKGSTDLKMKGVALVLEENGKFLRSSPTEFFTGIKRSRNRMEQGCFDQAGNKKPLGSLPIQCQTTKVDRRIGSATRAACSKNLRWKISRYVKWIVLRHLRSFRCSLLGSHSTLMESFQAPVVVVVVVVVVDVCVGNTLYVLLDLQCRHGEMTAMKTAQFFAISMGVQGTQYTDEMWPAWNHVSAFGLGKKPTMYLNNRF